MSRNWIPGDAQPNSLSDLEHKHGPYYDPHREEYNDHPLDHPALNLHEPEQLCPEPVRHLWSDHVDMIT